MSPAVVNMFLGYPEVLATLKIRRTSIVKLLYFRACLASFQTHILSGALDRGQPRGVALENNCHSPPNLLAYPFSSYN